MYSIWIVCTYISQEGKLPRNVGTFIKCYSLEAKFFLQLESMTQYLGAATSQAEFVWPVSHVRMRAAFNLPNQALPLSSLRWYHTEVWTKERQQAFIQSGDNTASQNHALEAGGKALAETAQASWALWIQHISWCSSSFPNHAAADPYTHSWADFSPGYRQGILGDCKYSAPTALVTAPYTCKAFS